MEFAQTIPGQAGNKALWQYARLPVAQAEHARRLVLAPAAHQAQMQHPGDDNGRILGRCDRIQPWPIKNVAKLISQQ